MRSIGAIIVIIATNISIALHICDATSITEIAPMYNIELITLDTMLLASNKFLFILFCFSFKKERKVPKERKNLFFISLMYRFVIAQRLRFNKRFLSYIYIRCIYVYNRKDSSIDINWEVDVFDLIVNKKVCIINTNSCLYKIKLSVFALIIQKKYRLMGESLYEVCTYICT